MVLDFVVLVFCVVAVTHLFLFGWGGNSQCEFCCLFVDVLGFMEDCLGSC